MGASCPCGWQEVDCEEDSEEEEERSSAPRCSAPRPASLATKQHTNSKKKFKLRRLWLPCCRRRSPPVVLLVNKTTSTTDLYFPEDAPQASSQQDRREKTPTIQGPFGEVSYSAGGEECVGRLSTRDWNFSSSPYSRSPSRHLTLPRGQYPGDTNTPSNKDEPYESCEALRARLETTILKDPVKATGGVLLSGNSHKQDGRRPHCRSKLRIYNNPKESDILWRKSPVWKRAQTPREERSDSRSPKWKNTYGRQDMSPRKDEPEPSHFKSAPILRTSCTTQRQRKDRDCRPPTSEAGLHCGVAVGMICALLAAVAALYWVHNLPACVNKVSWEVIPREALVLDLVTVTLLVIAVTSILLLVDGFQMGFFSESFIAFILILFNTALVDLLRCLCYMPNRLLWLTGLVLPLLLLSLIMLCRDIVVRSRST